MKKVKTCNLESEKTLFPTYTVRYFVTASIFSTALFLAIVHVWGQKLNFPFILFTFQFYYSWSLDCDFPNKNLQKTLFHEGRLVQPGSVGAVGAGTWQSVGADRLHSWEQSAHPHPRSSLPFPSIRCLHLLWRPAVLFVATLYWSITAALCLLLQTGHSQWWERGLFVVTGLACLGLGT